jgi:hypothetical protein
VAIPVAVFLVVFGLLNTRMGSETPAIALILLTAMLVLAAAGAASMLPLALTIVIMMVLVALLVAYHPTTAHQASRHLGRDTTH